MRWFLNYVPHTKGKYFFYNVIIILGDVLYIVPSILIGLLVDVLLHDFAASKIIAYALMIILVALFNRLLAYIGVCLLEPLCVDITNKIKSDLYIHLNELDHHFYVKQKIGELNTLFTTDTRNVKRTMSYAPKTLLAMIIKFCIAFIFCFKESKILTITILLPLIFIVFISKKFAKKTRPMYIKRREDIAFTSNYVEENIAGNKVTKNLCTQEQNTKRYLKFLHVLKKENTDIAKQNIFLDNKINLIIMISEILMFIVGGILVIRGSISLGIMTIFNNLLGNLIAPFINLGDLIERFQNFYVSVHKITKVLEEPAHIKNEGTKKLSSKIPSIVFESIDVSYENQIAVRNLNFEITPGSTVAFIGEVGSGKSSIAKLLLRFVEPANGTILINNEPIENYDLHSLRNKIGYVPQTPFLFSDTIANNVSYGTKCSKKDIVHYLSLARVTFVQDLPEKEKTIIGENGVKLSGGEKQRLSLARALAVKPAILILDDITSALDIENEMEIMNNINNLTTPCTKIIIAQKIYSVQNADQIFVMRHNKIVESGTHKDLLKKKGYYYELYVTQVKSAKEGAR